MAIKVHLSYSFLFVAKDGNEIETWKKTGQFFLSLETLSSESRRDWKGDFSQLTILTLFTRNIYSGIKVNILKIAIRSIFWRTFHK